ncbi:ABC transporter substrate-binding protein [Prosthecomicrobium sp. N25]|uniref:ABC transporter substrate-binding protein n=1 Tax=Prosthecomicrobium sp. N25 TaxID=3129254 RepID=UPI003076CFB5
MTLFQSIRAAAMAALVAVLPLGSAATAQTTKVQVALGDTISVETLAYLIALERAKERGVDYNLTSFAKEELAIQAVVNGQADLGIGTPYSVVQKSKAPLKAVFQVTRLVFFAVADKQLYKTWKDLDGQPFVFHARGTGTEAIGNILAERNGIKFGQRSYVAGSENRVVAMLNGQIKATIVDLANKNLLLAKGGDRFHVLPGLDEKASDEILFGRTDWLAKNQAATDVIVEEFARLWQQMAQNPKIIEQERAKRGLLKDLPKELLANVDKFYAEAVENGVFDKTGGSPAAVRADFDFYTQAGQMTGPAAELKVEEFWDFGPLERARKKIGG